MPDIIRLLPDSVANQIAAGEVIQRPASVVKELLENAIDAGAKEINLIIKDAGRTLIQISDNGIGMSETDARLCFERHATSKIKKAEDLFAIRSMGFRGEALAAIAAIAQVELKTRKMENELGTSVIIEASEVKSQETCSCNIGTSFAVKNIFFNIPARRIFLKSDAHETKLIIDEFEKVAIAFPHIALNFYHNNKEVYLLPAANSVKQRIANLFGKNYNERLIPVQQDTENVRINGYIEKPEFAKKHRGQQFFFVNNRFIKSSYFNHAILTAFKELIPEKHYPGYYVFFEVEPNIIDINIHPTKTEITFHNENMIYAILLATVRQALGKNNITPSLDFDTERAFDLPYNYKDKPVVNPQVKLNPDYNPFNQDKDFNPNKKDNTDNWEKLYKDNLHNIETDANKQQTINSDWDNLPESKLDEGNLILNDKYVLTRVKSGLLIIDLQKAYERIHYEKFLDLLEQKTHCSQQQLFPQNIELQAGDYEIIKEIINELALLGFEINDFGNKTIIVYGIPVGIKNVDIKELIESFIDNFKNNLLDHRKDKSTILARSMAKNISSRNKSKFRTEEITYLIEQLFGCKMPQYSPDGIITYKIITFEEIDNIFK